MRINNTIKNIWKECKQFNKYTTHGRKPFFQIAKEYLKDCKIILDIGAGAGDFIKYMGRSDIYAVDGNMDSVEILKKAGIMALHTILPSLPFSDKFFDGIHCSHVLEHLYLEDFYDTLIEINRVLKPGGILVISSPMLWNGFYSDLSHIKPYNPEILISYLCSSSAKQRTRPIIGGYELVNLTYRYLFIEPEPIIFFYSNISNFISLLIAKCLGKMGIGHVRKTGYTIVFKKLR